MRLVRHSIPALAMLLGFVPAQGMSQIRLDTLSAPPSLGQIPVVVPEASTARGRRQGPASPVAAPEVPNWVGANDFSEGGPLLGNQTNTPPANGAADCAPGTPCFRVSGTGLRPPSLDGRSLPLSVGVDQNFTATVQQNVQAVDELTRQIQEREDAAAADAAGRISTSSGAAAPAAPTEATATPQRPADRRQAAAGGPCATGADITALLSPACLETLRSLRPGGAGFSLPGMPGPGAPPAPQAAAQAQVQCGVALSRQAENGAWSPSSPVFFVVPDLPRCIEAGVRLGFGVPGLTNITASRRDEPLVAVVCYRAPASPAQVSCVPQPAGW